MLLLLKFIELNWQGIIALLALVISIWQGWQIRIHNKLSVRPRLTTWPIPIIFKNSRLMPAVLKRGHTIGITIGMTRMKNFQDGFPPFPTRYAIIAPDEDRDKFIQEANKPQLASLGP